MTPAPPNRCSARFAALEATRPSDAVIYRLLRLLKVGKVKVRAGRGARWVAGAVDFSDLRTEYVGIVYEGLLDYELRRSAPRRPNRPCSTSVASRRSRSRDSPS